MNSKDTVAQAFVYEIQLYVWKEYAIRFCISSEYRFEIGAAGMWRLCMANWGQGERRTLCRERQAGKALSDLVFSTVVVLQKLSMRQEVQVCFRAQVDTNWVDAD